MRLPQTTESSHHSFQQASTTPVRQPSQTTTEAEEPTDRLVAPGDHPHMFATTQPGSGVSAIAPAPSVSTAKRQSQNGGQLDRPFRCCLLQRTAAPPLTPAEQRWLTWVNEPGISAYESTERRQLSIKLERRLTFADNKIHVHGYPPPGIYASFTNLPDGMSVGGNLYLSNNRILTSLPDDLSVSGNLYLRNSRSLTSLPNGMSVGGSLYLSNSRILTSLPDDLSVSGNLDLRHCNRLITMPERLSVGGYLNLYGCSNLISMSKQLKVGSYLDLRSCTSLTNLSNELEAGSLRGLSQFNITFALPKKLKVRESLTLSDCNDLIRLPETLHVAGDLTLNNCRQILELPNDIFVGGTLALRNSSLNSLPRKLAIGQTRLQLDEGCNSIIMAFAQHKTLWLS